MTAASVFVPSRARGWGRPPVFRPGSYGHVHAGQGPRDTIPMAAPGTALVTPEFALCETTKDAMALQQESLPGCAPA
jgi:hypothetical protein